MACCSDSGRGLQPTAFPRDSSPKSLVWEGAVALPKSTGRATASPERPREAGWLEVSPGRHDPAIRHALYGDVCASRLVAERPIRQWWNANNPLDTLKRYDATTVCPLGCKRRSPVSA